MLARDSGRILLVASVAGVITAFTIYFYKRKKSEHKWSIPIALPEKSRFLIGHADYLSTLSGNYEICVKCANSEGVSRFHFLNSTAVSVLKAEHVEQLLTSSNFRQDIAFLSRHNDMFLGSKALISLKHDNWKKARKNLARAFSWECLKTMVSDINQVCEVFLETLTKLHGRPVDLWSTMKCITIEIIGKTAFGYNFNCVSSLTPSPIVEAFDHLLSEHQRRCFEDPLNPFSYFYGLPCESNFQHKKSRDLIRNTINSIIENRIFRRKNDSQFVEHNDLLKYLLDSFEENGDLSDPILLADNLMTMLFAGYDTSSITLAYAFYMMAKHPYVATKAREEVLRVLGPNGWPSYDDLHSGLPYCLAVVKECLRLYPPAPVTMRDLETPFELKINESITETLPAGTTIYIPIWWIHRSEHNFETPEEFDPERFFDPDRAKKIHRFAHIAFSGGGRDCIGRRFAMLELVAIFATVIRRISFECSSDYKVTPECHGFVQRPLEGISLDLKVL